MKWRKYGGSGILQVLDPSHDSWVLGGIFREVRDLNSNFDPEPLFIKPIREYITNPIDLLRIRSRLKRSENLLFSSLTPYMNFLRLHVSGNRTMRLWFTHKESGLTQQELLALQKLDVIFVHSSEEKNLLKRLLGDKISIIVTIGALDPKRFHRIAQQGYAVTWIGTSVLRKRPKSVIRIAQRCPDISFRIIGRGWAESNYWQELRSQSNIEYREIHGALGVEDFDGTQLFISLSQTEGGPMSLLEAMASGVPALVTDTGFARDLLSLNQKYPRIIENFSEDSAVAAIRQMLSENLKNQDKIRNSVIHLTMQKLSDVLGDLKI